MFQDEKATHSEDAAPENNFDKVKPQSNPKGEEIGNFHEAVELQVEFDVDDEGRVISLDHALNDNRVSYESNSLERVLTTASPLSKRRHWHSFWSPKPKHHQSSGSIYPLGTPKCRPERSTVIIVLQRLGTPVRFHSL